MRPALAFLIARRWRQATLFAIALAPALVALTLWKWRGLGEVPLFADGGTRLAAGLDDPAVASVTTWFDRTVHLDFDTWKQNMSNLREFSWSARVLQFLAIAGAIAVARRSLAAAGLLLGWLLGYVVVKGAADVATVESGSYWRLIMPALPAFTLLVASLPLLVPTLMAQMGGRLAPLPGRRPGLPGTVAVVAFLAVVPVAVLAAAGVSHSVELDDPPVFASDEIIVDEIGVPVDGSVISLRVRRTPSGNLLAWTDSTARARTFYRVYRASVVGGFPDNICQIEGGRRCELRAETLVTTRDRTYLDTDPPPDAVYRVGAAANWLDDPERGDVFALSPPAAPAPGS